MPAFEFEVEYAKSNRSACKHCKEKIDKDAVRVGLKALGAAEGQMGHVMESTRWHHFGCFQRVRGVAWFKKHIPQNIEEVRNFTEMKDEDRAKLSSLFSACKGDCSIQDENEGTCNTPSKSSPPNKRKNSAADDSSPKVAKLSSKGSLTDEQFTAINEAKIVLTKRSTAMLGALLAKNGLPKSGRKDELTERIAECQVLGVPPKCALCEKATLKWSRETDVFSCPGYFDDEAKSFKRCKGPGEGATVDRAPWQELTA